MADGTSYRVEDEFSIALIAKTAINVVEKDVAAHFAAAHSYRY